MKEWVCPSCGTTVTVETLRAPTMLTVGTILIALGRWVVSGTCPKCFFSLRITKSGITVTTRGRSRGREE